MANHVTLIIPPERLHPAGVVPTVFRIRRGDQNVVGANHVVSNLELMTVYLDAETTNSHVFDSGAESQFHSDSESFGFRPTP